MSIGVSIKGKILIILDSLIFFLNFFFIAISHCKFCHFLQLTSPKRLLFHESTQTHKRKTLQKKDIENAVLSEERYTFLDGIEMGNGS